MKRTIFYVFGNILIAFGVSLQIFSEFGTGTWDAWFVGLSQTIGLSTGSWVFIIGAFLLFLNKYLSKGKLDITAFLTILLVGYFIDFFMDNFFEGGITSSFFLQFPIFLLGMVTMSFGIGVYLQADFATNPVDTFMMNIHRKFGFSIRVSALISEAIACFFAFLFHGPIFVGTILNVLFLGLLIQFFYEKSKKLYEK